MVIAAVVFYRGLSSSKREMAMVLYLVATPRMLSLRTIEVGRVRPAATSLIVCLHFRMADEGIAPAVVIITYEFE